MARTLLPVAGGVLGGMVGGPMGARIGFAVGSVIGSIVDPVQVRGPSIGDVGAQTSAEGAPRAIVYGTAPVTGNVIACGELVRRWVNQRGGGKGAPKVKTEHVYRTFAIRICEGPIAGVLRVWEDDKLVYDVRPESPILAESQAWIANKTIYLGGEDQLPDPVLQAQVSGANDTPAYRGTAYIVVDSEDLTERRGSIPQYRFEVSTSAVVQTAVVLAVGDSSLGDRFASSDDGLAFGNLQGGPAYYQKLLGANDGRIINHSNAAAQRTDDLGATWHAISLPALVSSTQDSTGCAFGTFVLIPGGENGVGCLRSTDNGETFTAIAPAVGSRYDSLAYSNGRVLAVVATTGALCASADNGASFLAVDGVPDLTTANGVSIAAYSGGFMLGARRLTGVSAALWLGSGVGSWILQALPPGTGAPPQYITQPCAGIVGGAEILVCAGNPAVPADDDCTLWRSDDGGATWAVATAPSGIRGALKIRFNGMRFVALTFSGYYTSEDGATWVSRSTAPLNDVYDVAVSYERVEIAAEPVPLANIVSDVADRCGVDTSLIDVSELSDAVAGLVLAGEYTGADAIDVLRRPYFFDCAEYDGKVRFPKRGTAVVEVLAVDDLVEDPETTTREQAGEYPAKLHLFYQHAASGYARVKATAQRSSPDARVVGEVSIEVPVVLGEDEAARIAHKMHKASWADAEGEVKLSLGESFIRLVAADCVGLSLRGSVRRLRIEELQLADGRLQMTARVDRQSAYTSAVTGIPLPAPTPPPGTIVGATVLAVLDIPSRIDSEDDLNLYLAVSAVEPAWYGALVERSRDGGANFADAAQIERAMVVGVLTADLPEASAHYTDATNRVRLRLYRGSQDLESITVQAFLSGGGAFAVQSPGGGWEILQYLDADDLGDQEYELSTLHRGRLATTPAAHAEGSIVVFLDDVEHVPAQAAWIGQQLTHRATSFGETSESAGTQSLTYEGRSQVEWPVAYLTLERDSSDVISGAWTPRHRFGSDDFPVPSINFTGYRVTIDDGSTEVVLDTSDQHFTYDASALASPVTVIVAALNRITGAGPATSDTV